MRGKEEWVGMVGIDMDEKPLCLSGRVSLSGREGDSHRDTLFQRRVARWEGGGPSWPGLEPSLVTLPTIWHLPAPGPLFSRIYSRPAPDLNPSSDSHNTVPLNVPSAGCGFVCLNLGDEQATQQGWLRICGKLQGKNRGFGAIH